MALSKPLSCQLAEINNVTWFVADQYVLTRVPVPPSQGVYWQDGYQGYYALEDLNRPSSSPLQWAGPKAYTKPLSPDSTIKRIRGLSGPSSAVWRIGKAYLKLQSTAHYDGDRTREHVTLDYLHGEPDVVGGDEDIPPRGKPLSFHVPEVLFHAEREGVYILITTCLPGVTLDWIWSRLGEKARRDCARRVVDICRELMSRAAPWLGGIDGGELSDRWLRPIVSGEGNAADLVEHCKRLGMRCDGEAPFRLCHGNLSPRNIVVEFDIKSDIGLHPTSIGIVDWESAGFAPLEWIRTKFSISHAMNFETRRDSVRPTDWRDRIDCIMAADGFPEVARQWVSQFS